MTNSIEFFEGWETKDNSMIILQKLFNSDTRRGVYAARM